MHKPSHLINSASPHVTSLPIDISQEIKDGKVLAGDDFTEDQLQLWFSQEQEAFYEGDSGNSDSDPWYAYMRYVNEILGFPKIPQTSDMSRSILVLGPGPGIEMNNFATKNPDWTINFLEASLNYKDELRRKFPRSVIVDPSTSGVISLQDNSQDVVCAFSVLHHIPNVSKIICEVSRVMKPGGLFIVREPCSSMGDWRYPRSATPNERGISCSLLVSIAHKAGFVLASKPVPILFEPLNKILKKTIGFSFIPFELLYLLDRFISMLVSINDHYWRDSWYKKIGPSSFFCIFRKTHSQLDTPELAMGVQR